MSGDETPVDKTKGRVPGGLIVAGVLVLVLVVGGIFLLIGLTQGDVANPGGTPGEESSSISSPTSPVLPAS